MALNRFVEIKNATDKVRESISRKYGGCTVLNNSTFVCCDDIGVTELTTGLAVPDIVTQDIVLRNELFKALSNSLFIVEKDKNGVTVEPDALVAAHLLINPYVDNVQDTIGYYVNQEGLLMQETGTLVRCNRPVPDEVILNIKQILNQETMGQIIGDELRFI